MLRDSLIASTLAKVSIGDKMCHKKSAHMGIAPFGVPQSVRVASRAPERAKLAKLVCVNSDLIWPRSALIRPRPPCRSRSRRSRLRLPDPVSISTGAAVISDLTYRPICQRVRASITPDLPSDRSRPGAGAMIWPARDFQRRVIFDRPPVDLRDWARPDLAVAPILCRSARLILCQ